MIVDCDAPLFFFMKYDKIQKREKEGKYSVTDYGTNTIPNIIVYCIRLSDELKDIP